MKKLLITGTFVLFCTTLFSCTADENETSAKNEIKKDTTPSYADGPDDDPIKVPPPPK